MDSATDYENLNFNELYDAVNGNLYVMHIYTTFLPLASYISEYYEKEKHTCEDGSYHLMFNITANDIREITGNSSITKNADTVCDPYTSYLRESTCSLGDGKVYPMTYAVYFTKVRLPFYTDVTMFLMSVGITEMEEDYGYVPRDIIDLVKYNKVMSVDVIDNVHEILEFITRDEVAERRNKHILWLLAHRS